MANRRMFSKTVVHAEDFLEMPATTRLYYYDLGMFADDDGFVNPKMVMRMTNASEDDLRVLVAKKYVIPFEEKVMVIRDWKVNNEIRLDRYQETIYTDYKKVLSLEDNKKYKLPESIPTTGTTTGTTSGAPSIGKVRLVKNNISVDETPTEDVQEMKKLWKDTVGTPLRNHETENLKAYRYLKKETGEQLVECLQAVRMIRADKFQKRTLQAKLINYVGLRERLEEVEAFMAAHVDQKVIRKQTESYEFN